MTAAPQTPREDRTVAANGLDLAVAEYAAAPCSGRPPLVLLHGIGSRGVSWWPVVDALAVHFRVVVPDLRGHGGSARPPVGYLLPDYAADLAALVDGLGLERPRVLGHSLGGLVALAWAVAHPGGAAALVLEDTSLRGGPDLAPAFDGWLALNALPVEEAAAHFAREHPGWSAEDCRRRAESITGTARAVFAELRAESARPEPPDRIAPLAAVRAPTLLVHGDPDAGSMLHPADAARFADTVAGARVVRFPGGSHSLHRDRTEEFLAVVLPFLLNPTGEGEG